MENDNNLDVVTVYPVPNPQLHLLKSSLIPSVLV